ncbi:hypothetical protein GCK32_018665 [Trichostrongylus colubriformis]|uniref:Uncharacterized protein n=1 Tax=Trichostrongylus colubriformis TaxID=6319 RepID=A0AAN8FVD4_TRICO
MVVLRSRSCNDYELICSHHTWPANMRTLLDRFLKTPTEVLTDDTRVRIFEMVKEGVETLGTKWFAPEASLLILLVHLVVLQIRMCLDRPKSICSRSLAVYYHILEYADSSAMHNPPPIRF